MYAAFDPTLHPWRFQPHPQVWLLVVSLIAAYVYALRVIGPDAVRPGQRVVTRGQLGAFTGAMLLLWLASDWPMHDISEEYLYSAHMLQHMVLAYFVPPLALLATPEWLMRAIVGQGRGYAVYRWLTKPVVAGVMFNAVVMVTHIPGVVNASAENSPIHYSVHVLVVTTALLMWTAVCGPLRELQLGPAGKMVYLFAQSVVPTVPAGWLMFAEGVVYKHYDIPVRVFGLSATHDQQVAGLIMKLGGGFFLWGVIIFVFFKRFSAHFYENNTYRRGAQLPNAEIIGNEATALTYAEVQEAFERTSALPEPEPQR
ncbi:MAG: cytochrome c oxidase assembly protein [Acidimicrobiia bacterium]